MCPNQLAHASPLAQPVVGPVPQAEDEPDVTQAGTERGVRPSHLPSKAHTRTYHLLCG
jgi:hypothetical protein